MTQRITRFVIVAALAVGFVITGGTSAWAQCTTPPNYSPDFSNLTTQTCLTLTGTPAQSGYPGFFPLATPTTEPSGTPNPAQPAPGVATVLRLTPNSTFTSGSAWYNTQQPVSGAFSSTFTFQLSGTSNFAADGFAFVIQNSSANALDPDNGADGCSLGFGDAPDGTCTSTTGGITNSLAVEFDTYQNSDIDDPNGNHVAIQSCGMGPNSVEGSPLPGGCQIVDNTLAGLKDPRGNPLTLADGYPHTVTITYAPPSSTCGPQGTSPCPTMDVILDSNDLFPATGANPVFYGLNAIGLNSGNAWVGFTAATGGGDDNQDILSWTFTPQAQSAVVSQTAQATLSFPNAQGVNEYAYTAQLTAPYATPEIQVQPILITQAACDALVQVNFWPARCFVYANAEGLGENMSVLFSVTCPTSPGGTCGTGTNFDATLGTVFNYVQAENPLFVYPGILGLLNPFPGWLKGGTGTSPCTPPASGPLFTSNQISSFVIDNGVMKGGSGGGASCWVATYDTPGEIWPGISISSPTFTTYKQGQVVTANYTCTNPATSKSPLTSPTGPYLTVASCTQVTGTQTSCSTNPSTGAISCTGSVPTTKKGLQLFEVTSLDSGQNQNVDLVIYNVK